MNFAREIRIDSVLTLPERVLPSPMQGVMSSFFIRAATKLDLAKLWITPFLSIGKESVPSRAALGRILAPWGTAPLIVQLMGRHAGALAETALRLAETGHPAVNINFACPAPTVVRAGHGASCLRELKLMDTILREIIRVCGPKISLSVKLRTGWESPSESEAVMKTVRDAGVRFVIVHFRTAAELYAPVPDFLPRLAAVRRELGPEVVFFGNGDIASLADAETMCAETMCDGVAVGRALLRDPSLLARIRQGDSSGPDANKSENLLRAIHAAASDSGRWNRNGFLECVRMCRGENSPEFRSCVRMTKEELDRMFR